MEKSDYNIEFAHIYINENFTSEHYQSCKIAKDKKEELIKQGKNTVFTVLIDDYNPSDNILDIDGFFKEIEALGAKPDYAVYESKLTFYKDTILSEMNGRIKKQYERYICNRGKCPCSFLIAIWHLIRLGLFNTDPIIKNLKEKPFAAKKIITILPQRYAGIEKRALEIIESTKYKNLVKNKLDYIFF